MSASKDRPLALVTGAARRIGRAIALDLADAGHDVAIHCHRSVADAESLAAEIAGRGVRAAVFVADLAAPGSGAELAARVVVAMGPVRVLVNNASAFHATPLASTRGAALAEDLRRFHAVHVAAPLELLHGLLPGMRALGEGGSGSGGCVVVNVGDADRVRPGFAPYVASKAGLRALTRTLARELAPHVRVNMVEPGAILPPAGAGDDVVPRIVAAIPFRRLGTVEEIAATVRFLVTGPAFLTGQVIAVDGAQHL